MLSVPAELKPRKSNDHMTERMSLYVLSLMCFAVSSTSIMLASTHHASPTTAWLGVLLFQLGIGFVFLSRVMSNTDEDRTIPSAPEELAKRLSFTRDYGYEFTPEMIAYAYKESPECYVSMARAASRFEQKEKLLFLASKTDLAARPKVDMVHLLDLERKNTAQDLAPLHPILASGVKQKEEALSCL